ncbi:uncharacterized protein METZ01_LOCUS185460 [marine metagenome]|uniref:Uncharacterized protein n=1 Tax=marine metagenome TaxID=408172 RepID=A0A382D292_9ZZZZ
MDENTTPAHYTDTRFCGKDGMVEVDLARDARFKRNIVKSCRTPAEQPRMAIALPTASRSWVPIKSSLEFM